MKLSKKIFSIVGCSVGTTILLSGVSLGLVSCFGFNKNKEETINGDSLEVKNPDSLLFSPINAQKARTLSVNVGMGDAEIIQVSQDNNYGGKDDFTILIDGGTGGAQGGKEASSPNGIFAVSSALNWLKISDIDLFVISHPHNDHMYGLPEIILNYATDNSKALVGIDAWNKKVSSSATTVMKKVAAALEKKNIETFDSVQIVNEKNKNSKKGKWTPSKLIQFKNPLTGDEIGSFSILGCTDDMNSTSMNAYSISNMFKFNNHSELFAGDSEGDTDNQLLEYYNVSELKVDIYKVSHHGSHTEGSNTNKWLSAIKPTYAIISAGAEDKYTLPDVATLQELLNVGIKPENILGTQPFGKSLVLANQTSDKNQTIVNNWKNTNNFLNSHTNINNNNNGATIQANGSKTTGSFVDLNTVNDENWTTIDGYYNMVMKGVGVHFDFSSSGLKLNQVDTTDINVSAWNPSAWDQNGYVPVSPNGKTWYKLSTSDYKNNTGLPQITNIIIPITKIGTKK